MENIKTPRAIRQLVVLSAVFLAASLIISGVNAYVAFASPAASPFVPTKVGFEGQLSDSSGNAVTGSKTLIFRLYDQSTGTNAALWTETQTVTVTNGLYTVQLGAVNALDASKFQGDRWLGIQVQGDSNELSPRIPVSAVPFSLNARQAMGLQGYDVASVAPANGQVLTWNSSAWVPQYPAILDTNQVIVNNSTPTTIYSITLPPGALYQGGASKLISLKIWYDVIQDTGTSNARSFTVTATLGSGTNPPNMTYSYAAPNHAGTRPGYIELMIIGTSNSIRGDGHINSRDSFEGAPWVIPSGTIVDHTVAQNLTVAITLSLTCANFTLTKNAAVLHILTP